MCTKVGDEVKAAVQRPGRTILIDTMQDLGSTMNVVNLFCQIAWVKNLLGLTGSSVRLGPRSSPAMHQ